MSSSSLLEAIAADRLDELENEWLVLVSESPQQLDTYLEVVDSLADRLDEARLRSLLEVLDEQLVEGGHWDERLRLIRHSGKRYLKSGHIFEAVVESVRGLYADRAQELETLMPTLGLDKGRDDTPKLWDKVERLRSLFAYRVGTVVHMKDKGVGTVTDVNLELQTLKIDFEKYQGLSVGFRAAGKMLDILDPSHVLFRKVQEPEALAALEPAELLRVVLESFDRALTGAEVKDAVAGLVDKDRWSSWWAAARKHPQVVTEPGKRQSYSWAASSEHAREALWETFEGSDPRTRLDLLRKAGSQDETLQRRMVESLRTTVEGARDSDPALAFEIWQQLDRLGEAPTEWSPRSLLTEQADPLSLALSLGTRTLREAAYRELALEDETRRVELLQRAFLQEGDPKALATLAELLRQHGQAALDRVLDQALSQPRKAPDAFTWLAERAAEDESIRQPRGARMLKQILAALGDESFAGYRARLEHLGESGGTLPRILSGLTEEEAREAETAIADAHGLPSYQRQPLLNALHLKFPDLRREQEQPLYATREALKAKRRELKELLEEEIPANRKAIETAREMGDLRENFEYKAARQRHEYLAARATQLNEQIARARVIDPSAVDADRVRVGTRLELRGPSGERTLTVLGPWESDPEAGVISHESELAGELLGKGVGDTVRIGDEELEITGISIWE